MDKKKKQIGITLDKETLEKLAAAAKKLGLTNSQYISLIINKERIL